MTAYDLPSNQGFVDSDFYIQFNSQSFSSPLSNAMQRQEQDGPRYIAVYSLPSMSKDKAAVWKAFFNKMRGQVNTFNGYNPDFRYPRGAAGGTPLVAGASQTGYSLNIDGCTASAIFLREGDMFSVGGELNEVVSNATADGSGNVTLTLARPFRASPADNAAIVTSSPTCQMILTDDDQASFKFDKNGFSQPKTFTAIEVFS